MHFMPEICWHDRQAILSIDIQPKQPIKTEAVNYNKSLEEKDLPWCKLQRIATASFQKEVRIWNFFFEPGEPSPSLSVNFLANLTAHPKQPNVVRFSPDGHLLASGDSSGLIFLWKIMQTDENQEPLQDGKNFENIDDDFPKNRENWQRALNSPLKHDEEVTNLCWSPDSNKIASASMDNSILIHDSRTGKRVGSLRNFRHFPNGIAWDPRGKYIVIMSTNRHFDIIDAYKFTRLRNCSRIDLPETIINKDLIILQKNYKIFHDDQLNSFTRGVDFSPCGSIVFTPAGHLELLEHNAYGTFVFRRSDFDQCRPCAFLSSTTPSISVKCNPVIFELRDDVEENYLNLPYRIVYAVMTREVVYIYDSQFSYPFHYFANLQLDDLTCMTWTPNGDILVISSIEGYNTFLTIDLDSIGKKHPNPFSKSNSLSSEDFIVDDENSDAISALDSPKLAKPPIKKTLKKAKDNKEENKEIVNVLIPRSIKSQKTLSEFFKS